MVWSSGNASSLLSVETADEANTSLPVDASGCPRYPRWLAHLVLCTELWKYNIQSKQTERSSHRQKAESASPGVRSFTSIRRVHELQEPVNSISSLRWCNSLVLGLVSFDVILLIDFSHDSVAAGSRHGSWRTAELHQRPCCVCPAMSLCRRFHRILGTIILCR